MTLYRFAAQVRLVPDSPDGSEDGQQRKVRRDLLETSAASTMDGSGGGGGGSSMVVPEPEPEPDEGCETQTNADAFPTSVFAELCPILTQQWRLIFLKTS